MKIVINGGSGLIGRKLVNNLRQHGHQCSTASGRSRQTAREIFIQSAVERQNTAVADAVGVPWKANRFPYSFCSERNQRKAVEVCASLTSWPP
jgi:NAD dependent epimerase/dehydratase family enzyme